MLRRGAAQKKIKGSKGIIASHNFSQVVVRGNGSFAQILTGSYPANAQTTSPGGEAEEALMMKFSSSSSRLPGREEDSQSLGFRRKPAGLWPGMQKVQTVGIAVGPPNRNKRWKNPTVECWGH